MEMDNNVLELISKGTDLVVDGEYRIEENPADIFDGDGIRLINMGLSKLRQASASGEQKAPGFLNECLLRTAMLIIRKAGDLSQDHHGSLCDIAQKYVDEALSLEENAKGYYYLGLLRGERMVDALEADAYDLLQSSMAAFKKAEELDPDGQFGQKAARSYRELQEELPSESQAKAKSGGCYIATACYGSYDHPDVVLLRRFRDERLMTSKLGRILVRAYYVASPPLALRLGPASWLSSRIRYILSFVVLRIARR